METIQTEILVVGGGTGGTAAAIQAARRGAKTLLVSEFDWLGGMLTSAGVCAPDGNELRPWQTGIWGQFLGALHQAYDQNQGQKNSGLGHGWVSFFTYEPKVGAQIFANWVKQLPNLSWIVAGAPVAVERQDDRLTAVQFNHIRVEAQIILDGTELGDLLELGQVPYRWGWEPQEQWAEPSAPTAQALATDPFYQNYPAQAPTWVVLLQDFGANSQAPEISPPPNWTENQTFSQAWANYGPEQFLNYGRLPGDRFMINWPIHGNDYGEGVQRLIGTPAERQTFHQEALWHSQGFAHFIQSQLGRRYGLALDSFPLDPNSPKKDLGGGAFGLHPYYRESRRVQGLVTVIEQDILPQPRGRVAPLAIDPQGQATTIAVGNYANDHHYPGREIPLAPKSLRWGGRWTGTPFSLPYGCLVPATVDGLLVCEKNISVSHMANGATRLQPLVLALGQAAGMAAALCIAQNCQPRELAPRDLQGALLRDAIAPALVVPLFDLLPQHPDWATIQGQYLREPQTYPLDGNHGICKSVADKMVHYAALTHPTRSTTKSTQPQGVWVGQLQVRGEQDYGVEALAWVGGPEPIPNSPEQDSLILVTQYPKVNQQLQNCPHGQTLKLWGKINQAGKWLCIDYLEVLDSA